MTKVAMFPVATHDFNKPDGKDYSYKCEGASLTRQEFAEECDINAIMARYEGHVIGGPGNLPPAQPMYADFTSHPTTLMEFMDMQMRAETAFMSLPAPVRKEFDNDPMMFVDFASDPENLEQMRTWGLAPPAKAPEVPNPPAAAEKAPAPPSASTAPGGAPTQSST